jgi:tetratricopeptide (TPR) repeat protein
MKTTTILLLGLGIFFLISCAGITPNQQPSNQYWDKAKEFQSNEKFIDAAQMYEKAAEAEKNNQEPLLAELTEKYYHAGLMYDKAGKYDKAIENYIKALDIAKKLGQDDKTANTLNNLGNMYSFNGDSDKAIKQYEESLVINKKLDKKDDVAKNLRSIASERSIKGNKESLMSFKKLGLDDAVVQHLKKLGRAYTEKKQYEQAIEFYKKALMIIIKLDQKKGETALLLNYLGNLYGDNGQYDKAIKQFEEALMINKELGCEIGVATNLNNIGNIYKLKKQNEKAIKFQKEASMISNELSQKSKKEECSICDGNCYNGKGTQYHINCSIKYVGTFKNSLWHGSGEIYRKNGTKEFEGYFINGMKHGEGVEFSADGLSVQFKGNWIKGKKEIAECTGDCINGEGKFYRTDGSKEFEGHFKDGMKHGEGTEFWVNGKIKRQGMFSNGYIEQGTIFNKKGQKLYKGKFEYIKMIRGVEIVKGIQFFPSGSIKYDGEFKYGKYHGRGKLYFEDGEFIESEFKNGKTFSEEKVHKTIPTFD